MPHSEVHKLYKNFLATVCTRSFLAYITALSQILWSQPLLNLLTAHSTILHLHMNVKGLSTIPWMLVSVRKMLKLFILSMWYQGQPKSTTRINVHVRTCTCVSYQIVICNIYMYVYTCMYMYVRTYFITLTCTCLIHVRIHAQLKLYSTSVPIEL